MTHAFNMNQRINQLAFTRQADGLTAAVPANPNLLLPGHYLLFALNAAGVPSVGRVIAIT